MRSHRPLKYMKFDHRYLELLINTDEQWLSGKHTAILIDPHPQTRSIQDVIVLRPHAGIKREEESDGK